MSVFKIENLTYYYPEMNKPAIDNINMEIKKGEFVLLVGESGCGKTTLLRLFAGLIPSFYGGTIKGDIIFKDKSIVRNKKTLAPKVGILFQDPEKQIIMTDVKREIVFGMENMGLEPKKIKKRLEEIITYMQIEDLVEKKINELSTGQKQKVGLAAVLAMKPEVLLLDEPTSQMDTVFSEEILNTIRNIAKNTGRTIVMADQKLEKSLQLADRVIAIKDGEISDKEPSPVRKEAKSDRGWFLVRKEGKPEISIKNLWFSYDDKSYALKDIDLEFYKGNITCISGRNGAGKTTLVKNINGLLKPSKGSIEIQGELTAEKSIFELSQKIGFLAQNPDNYLLNDTVKEEIKYTLDNFKLKWNEKIDKLIEILELQECLNKNPRDLSTGQKQRTALASVLSVFPDILILDEPTRGMDYIKKEKLGKVLVDLKTKGMTIILVTHDEYFATQFSDRIIVMKDGEIREEEKSFRKKP